MSHFVVTVIGPENEQQLEEDLAPYYEGLEVESYFEPVDVDRMAEHYKTGKTLAELQPFANSWVGSDLVEEGGQIGYYSSYNPDSKWDWWVIGGRWADMLPTLSGDKVDYARKKDIDFESARKEAAQSANAAYSKWETFCSTHDVPPSWNVDPKDRSKFLDSTQLQEYLQRYRSDPRVIALSEEFPAREWGFAFNPIEEFGQVSREEYVEQKRIEALMTYALLVDGSWLAPGDMGWWGISSDSRDNRIEFAKKFHEIIESLYDDTMIWIVDCHI